ncbi:septation initiation network scaffold protein cdc11 [Sarocladium implicatum]|nr:septation initiation network scaffold protein cdc11 [Sarocladium implicatum]
MEHAWLDSLSEDWVSQPASDTSIAQLPPLTDETTKKQTRDFSSRKLQHGAGAGSSLSPANEQSINILSERSTNEILASRSRNPSKLSQEIGRPQGPENHRIVSTASNASVIRNTVNQKASPGKFDGQTPEWKRRLLHGNMAYGEQRDLFCSAAAGLQDMFKPPESPENNASSYDQLEHEATLPSSPPAYPQRVISGDLEDAQSLDGMDDYEEQHPNDISPSPSPRRQPRGITYTSNLDESAFGPNDTFNLGARGSPRAAVADEIYRDESCLTVASHQQGESRKVSGQSDTRNEDFSPIIIGKHSDHDGRVDFAPVEIHVDQLQYKLERLRINQMLLDSQLPTEDILGLENAMAGSAGASHDWASQAANINTRRGGRSAEGSFRYRGLSPSMGCDTSEMLPEESLQASTPKQFPTVRTEMIDASRSPSLPRAPFPSPEKKSGSLQGRSFLGGSPLKLFGPYDTFTNQTLLRRISQFEEGTSGSTSRQSMRSVIQEGHSPSRTSHAFIASPSKAPVSQDTSRQVSHFGGGDFEGYEFNSDHSLASMERLDVYGRGRLDSAALSSPLTYQAPQSRESSPVDDSEMLFRRKRDHGLTPPATKGQTPGLSQRSEYINTTPKDPATTPRRDAGSEGKRPRTSPSKDPTPKRRRTLHRSDIAFGRGEPGSPAAKEYTTSAAGKRDNIARPREFELASPDILAMRTLLRPRSPTPTQRSSESKSRQPPGYFDLQRDQPSSTKSPVRALRSEGSPASRHAPAETDRKPSIRTQDFVDQAAQIMAMIRSQVRPQGLASVEESEAEGDKPSPGFTDESCLDSTNEPFDRPPSREGAPMPRLPRQQEDPDVVSRLKKYQEASEMGDIISSSMRSLGFARDAVRRAQADENQVFDESHVNNALPLNDGDEFISDIPNIRLSTAPIDERPVSRDFHSNSSGNNTNGSYPTNSSRGSDSRKIIMPESVSHLIPDRVGSMYLDKHKNIWIKKKEEATEPAPELPPSDDSEEDPFASIPDLTVDMTREMQNLKLATERKQRLMEDAGQSRSPSSPTNGTKNSNGPQYTTISPEQLKTAMLHQSGQDSPSLSLLKAADDEAEQNDGSPELPSMEKPAAIRRRNLTIAFSSPIASIIQEAVAEDLDSIDEYDMADGKVPMSATQANTGRRPAMKSQTRDFAGPDSQNPRAGFVPRPVSRIDEQDEDSTVEMPYDDQRQISLMAETSIVSHHKTPNARNSSLSFFFNRTPGTQALSVRGDESALIGNNVGKLSLSPLSEFTLNNSDQSFGLEVSYVMGPRRMETGDGSKRVMSMTIRELVDKLSEAEPYEPFWEDMSELTLSDKRLTSLHMLDEFCGRLVSLDASNNKLGHLEGVPSSVRQLKANHNLLTELTSWDHLMNLQYIDISGNEVTSLSALKNLVHLRSIKADNNHLTSLDGLDGHDGLLSLRARDNDIAEIDFADTRLERLADLDLGGNRIAAVRNLDKCPSLSRLRLERNELRVFAPKRVVKVLRVLDISDNCLSSLDVSAFPGLHTLHADRNCISTVVGFQRCRRLDSLSLREQHGEEPLDMTFLSTAYEVRKLFLSGNFMGSFEPHVDFLNLQLLDLANCGLRELPRMMGQLMPNLRTLNINFNAVSDLTPLLFVPRVKKLLAAGNRLADSTAVTELLTEFPHLTQLDLRDNPVTQGFYAPLQVLVTTDNKTHVDPFVLPDADGDRDETYARRLDEATKLRRRLHQVVFAASCRRLRRLDGLTLDRHSIMARDEVLHTLIEDGLLPDIGAAPSPEPKKHMSPQREQQKIETEEGS